MAGASGVDAGGRGCVGGGVGVAVVSASARVYESSSAKTGQLPDVAPPGSLRLSQGVWGVDPSTLRVSVAVVKAWEDVGVLDWGTRSLGQFDRGARRLERAHWELVPWFEEWAERRPPGFVLVEQPFGRHVHPQSYFMVGVVLAALARVVDCPVDVCSPPEWKRMALGAGRGAADKWEIMEWARAAGYSGSLQDEADAIGIATAAGVRVEGARRG